MENVLTGILLSQLILIPLALKWELHLMRVIPAGIVIGILSGIAVTMLPGMPRSGFLPSVAIQAVLILVSFALFVLARFYRDPERSVPDSRACVVCPADGVVKYIKQIEGNAVPLSTKGREAVELAPGLLSILPEGKGYLVGIGMSFLDVHVTRAPIGGKVTFTEHVDGGFHSLKKPEAVCRNERVNQVIENDRFGVGLIFIASRLVRRIVSRVGVGCWVTPGQRIGMIRFGSQTDLVLPLRNDLRVRVNVGDRVRAGETVIAEQGGDT
jgi:phosphatidylserine decarboxylase